jgi:hypothetical protein
MIFNGICENAPYFEIVVFGYLNGFEGFVFGYKVYFFAIDFETLECKFIVDDTHRNSTMGRLERLIDDE